MRKSLIFFSLAVLSIAVSGQLLTVEENLKRSETCGSNWDVRPWDNVFQGLNKPPDDHLRANRPSRPKRVSSGKRVSTKQAPWMVLVNFTVQTSEHNKTRQNWWTSGVMISRRHILTDSSVLLPMPLGVGEKATADTWIWRFNGERANMPKCSKTGYVEAPIGVAEEMSVRVCRSQEACEAGERYRVRKVHFIGHCNRSIESYGLTLIETIGDLKDQGKGFPLSPICLPKPDLNPKPEETVRLYALGPVGTKEYEWQIKHDRFHADLRRGDVLVKNCSTPKSTFEVAEMSICVESNVCGSDIGAAYVQEIDKKMTAVAIARYGRCGWKEEQPQVSVMYFMDKICILSGVCYVDPNAEFKDLELHFQIQEHYHSGMGLKAILLVYLMVLMVI